MHYTVLCKSLGTLVKLHFVDFLSENKYTSSTENVLKYGIYYLFSLRKLTKGVV